MTSRLVSGPLCFTNIKIVSTSIHSSSTVGLDDRRRVVRLCVNTYCFVILQVRILNYWKEVTRCWSQHSLGPKRDQDGDQDGVYVYGTKTGRFQSPDAEISYPKVHEIDQYTRNWQVYYSKLYSRSMENGVYGTGYVPATAKRRSRNQTTRHRSSRPAVDYFNICLKIRGPETKRLVIGRREKQLTISIFV